jgi:tetratricopeptide (TPR) repeat protein
MKKKALLLMVFTMMILIHPCAQFNYPDLTPLAAESFRLAVEAYGSGRFAEALSQFERALSLAPSDPLSLYWLGKSYLRLGISRSAFDRWNEALAIAGPSPFVESRLELFGAMADPAALSYPDRYVRVDELAGEKKPADLFLRPTWVEPLPDGGAIIVSHGTNNLLELDANARIIRTINAGSSGFDRPFAIATLDDGTMFVSEFQSDRIVRLSANGSVLGYSGDKTGPGRLSGPQYLTVDADSFVYATDVGFSRVVKYTREGAFVLTFGTKTATFDGLRMPTGIVALNDMIVVADSVLKSLYKFDEYGNYIGKLDTLTLERPEGLRLTEDGLLLLADGSRVLLIHPETGEARELYRSVKKSSRIISAAFDANGELLLADFDTSEILYLSDPATRFAGLSVEVGRIYSDDFPQISLDLTVKDRFGRPITGLGASNFYISENIVRKESRVEGDIPVIYAASSIEPVSNFIFEGALDASDRIDVAFLLEGSPEIASMRLEARDAVTAIYQSLGAEATKRLVIAGRTAQPASGGSLSAISKIILESASSNDWRMDSGLRLAAGSLFELSGRRVLVYIGTGSVNEQYLQGTTLSELSSILIHNNIVLFAVILGKGSPSEALSFLVERSRGAMYRANRPEGLAVIQKTVQASKTGTYRLSFTSGADDGFGRSYLPFNVEVYLRDRSGKDETGYFAPLR